MRLVSGIGSGLAWRLAGSAGGVLFGGAGLGDQGEGYLLAGELLCVIDQLGGPASFADAVGEVKDGERGRMD